MIVSATLAGRSPSMIAGCARPDCGWRRATAYPAWFGLFLPAKTPGAIVDKLHRETQKALQAPKVRDRLAALGVDPMVMTPSEFDASVQNDIAVNAALVKAVRIEPD